MKNLNKVMPFTIKYFIMNFPIIILMSRLIKTSALSFALFLPLCQIDFEFFFVIFLKGRMFYRFYIFSVNLLIICSLRKFPTAEQASCAFWRKLSAPKFPCKLYPIRSDIYLAEQLFRAISICSHVLDICEVLLIVPYT